MTEVTLNRSTGFVYQKLRPEHKLAFSSSVIFAFTSFRFFPLFYPPYCCFWIYSSYLRRDLGAIDEKRSPGKALSARQVQRLDTIRTIYEQQKYIYDHHTHHVSDRIVSVSQPFIRPIVRGKAGKPVEFGAKLDISVVDGGRGWNAAPLTPTMRREICRRWRSGSVNGKDIIQAAFWWTRSTETVKISAIARPMGSVFPVRRWDDPGKARPETRLRIKRGLSWLPRQIVQRSI